MIDVGIGAALLGGLISFLSPCVLPLVPPYLCYIGGVSLDEVARADAPAGGQRRVFRAAVAFVLGFSTVFVSLGATASLIGQTLATYAGTLAVVGGVLIVLMGLHFTGIFRLPFLNREARFHVGRKPPGAVGGYLMGLAFAFGWTPCIGPILAAILFVAGSSETVLAGAGLLGVYSLGLGIPFLVAAAFMPLFLRAAARFRRHLGLVEKGLGAFLVLTGILFITGSIGTISYWMLETFPALGTLG